MKVKLPNNVVHVLTQLKKTHSNTAIIRSIWQNDAKKTVRTLQLYVIENGEDGLNNVMRALLDGYEAEAEVEK